MNKYIDVEKLIAEIKRRKAPFKKDIEDGVYPTYLCALMDFEDLVTSLQQEQPEVDIEKEYAEFVDADPVYSKLVNDIVGKAIARHFYELSKARKDK